MRGSGDVPLSAETIVALSQDIIATQREILTQVFSATDVNIRRFPLPSERNRKGGAGVYMGVYYHIDYIGGPRDHKWIQYKRTSVYGVRARSRPNLDPHLKPSEMATEFFVTYGYDTLKQNKDNLNSFVRACATHEFGLTTQKSALVAYIEGNLIRFNARRKPGLWNSMIHSLTDY